MQFLNRTVAWANRIVPTLCVGVALSAGTAAHAANQSAPKAGDTPGAQASTVAAQEHITPDDPVKVRDALAGQMPGAAPHSLSERLRNLAREPFGHIFRGHAAATDNGQRTFLFMIPAPHGILYRSNTDMLSVNVPLASDEHPDAIQLYESIVGPSGRGLVIAPDAKAKGYIQKIDSIELRTQGKTKTTARGRLKLSQENFEKADDYFAVVLVCTLEPPYLTETREHDEPTDEEPTDVTRRVSTLHGNIQAVWLVNRKDGTVLSKGLRLAK
ncbi:hypothetical protein [Paraburkholderia sp. LEh10]|uniref:hypothetical protein n=1 Tax=Paraburkholderia sp. LEh10 TaxID=2821353 RepID=UPI0028A8A056|nr:hypothetical protein [Paraburkholderia sp. LEh10]